MNVIIQGTLLTPEHITALLPTQATRNAAGNITLTLSVDGKATAVEVLHAPNKNDPHHEEKMATMLKNCAAIFYFPGNNSDETFYMPSLTETSKVEHYGLASKYYVIATESLAQQDAKAMAEFKDSGTFKSLEKMIALQLAQVHLDDPSTLNDLFVTAIKRHQEASEKLRNLTAMMNEFMRSSPTDKPSFVAYSDAAASSSQPKNEAPAANSSASAKGSPLRKGFFLGKK